MEKFKYEKRYWYPHMGPQDVKIWERFIDANPGRFDECVYDLPIGRGAVVDEDTDEKLKGNWQYLTKYKIDVLCFKGDTITVVEVKPRAGLGSIGQVINYADIYIKYIDEKSDPKMVIATDELRSDMDWLCQKRGISLEVV